MMMKFEINKFREQENNVTPAKAGVQKIREPQRSLDSRLRGNDGTASSETICSMQTGSAVLRRLKAVSKGAERIARMGAYVLPFLLLTGCVDFEANHMVTKFKVMAVQTEPPEIAPGDGFEMKVLYADPKGAGREVSFAWMMCLNAMSPTAPLRPEMGLGACMPVLPPIVETKSNDGHIFVSEQTPDDLMSLYPQELLQQSSGVPVDAQIIYLTAVVVGCAGGTLPGPAGIEAVMSDLDNPADLCQGGDGWATHKVLRVTPPQNTAPNENPVISQIRVEDQLLPLRDATGASQPGPLVFSCDNGDKCSVEVEITVNLSPRSAQTYHTKSADGYESIEEVLYVTWFTSGGELERNRTVADEPAGPCEVTLKTDHPGLYTLWAVAHDVRGGVSWEWFQIQVTDVPSF